jgi:hypothetical protein
VRSIIVIALLCTLVYAQKNIEVIPADVNYTHEEIADFSDSLYDIFQSAIAEYNYLQDSKESMLKVKENATPKLKYVERIKRFHREISQDSSQYMKRRALSYLLVLDFSSKKIAKVLDTCQTRCPLSIKVKWYKSNEVLIQDLQLTYNGRKSLLTQGSVSQINKAVQKFIGE